MILIKGGTVITSESRRQADVLIAGEKILRIAPSIDDSDAKIIDANNRYVIPGGIDPHVHFHLNIGNNKFTSDSFAEGTRAALLGGTTSVIDFITPNPGESLKKAFEKRLAETTGAFCDFGFHQTVTSWTETTATELQEMKTHYGIPSCKIYLAYKDKIGINDDVVLKVMEIAAKENILILAHCEHGEAVQYRQNRFFEDHKRSPRWHGESRPAYLEGEAVTRACALAEITGAKLYVVHTSSIDGIGALKKAQERGTAVVGEACIHHLILDDSRYTGPFENASAIENPDLEAAKFIMSPPLRNRKHANALWTSLCKEIRCVATDHCAFNVTGQKDQWMNDFRKIPNGVPGVANRMQLLYSKGVKQNRISMEQFVALTSENAAKTFGLFPKKGTIAEGSDADLVIWAPDTKSVITAETDPHVCDYSPYEGMTVHGSPEHVMLRGRWLVKNRKLAIAVENGSNTAPATGIFLKRSGNQ